jgi:hypothetical protein
VLDYIRTSIEILMQIKGDTGNLKPKAQTFQNSGINLDDLAHSDLNSARLASNRHLSDT